MAPDQVSTLPAIAWWAALASLPRMGPARLLALRRAWSGPEAWRSVLAGRVLREAGVVERLGPDPRSVATEWRRTASRIDVADLWAAHVAAGIGAAVHGSAGYPSGLDDDPEPPVVLFHRGDLDHLAGPRVAVIGTRRCSRYGLDVARQLGHDLASAGVRVVSGLALGIDGAAHQGVLAAAGGSAAPPIGVVASGLDHVYPRRHAGLFARVAEQGVLCAEAPLGCRPEAWRFPSRNRIIAGLSDLVVVVESGERGGSMYTVEEAERRGVPVMAVPGPVRSGASSGTNRLLFEGAAVVRDAIDVLERLGLEPAAHRSPAEVRPTPHGNDHPVLEAIGWQPISLEQLASRVDGSLESIAASVARLEVGGWVAAGSGWIERVARSDG